MRLLLIFVPLLLAAQTVPVDLLINWPPAKLVAAKYGPLPRWAMFGEVIGCNRGSVGLTYGEGDVLALLRNSAGLQAFSIQDAMMLVSNSQSASKWNRAKGWILAGANSVVGAKAAGLIGGGNATGVGIVIGAEVVNIVLPNLSGALNLKQVIAYSRDGLQSVMVLPAGRCTIPYSVLFAVPGPSPNAGKPMLVHADVPADR